MFTALIPRRVIKVCALEFSRHHSKIERRRGLDTSAASVFGWASCPISTSKDARPRVRVQLLNCRYPTEMTFHGGKKGVCVRENNLSKHLFTTIHEKKKVPRLTIKISQKRRQVIFASHIMHSLNFKRSLKSRCQLKYRLVIKVTLKYHTCKSYGCAGKCVQMYTWITSKY